VNPGGGSGWDEPPLDVHVPDDARELDRDVLAYHRELRAERRRRRLRRLTRPVGPGTVLPRLASILAVCLVGGAMLSVATFNPEAPATPSHPSASAASRLHPARQRSLVASARPSGSRRTARPSGSANSPARSSPRASQVGQTFPPH
jgi:hypothetical protein